MKCEGCGQVSDYIGPASEWQPVHEGETVMLQLFECATCGHHQRPG